jgi:hypothetical protein
VTCEKKAFNGMSDDGEHRLLVPDRSPADDGAAHVLRWTDPMAGATDVLSGLWRR